MSNALSTRNGRKVLQHPEATLPLSELESQQWAIDDPAGLAQLITALKDNMMCPNDWAHVVQQRKAEATLSEEFEFLGGSIES